MHKALAVLLLLAACGDDDAPPPPKPGQPGAPGTAAAGTPVAKLVPRAHVEDRIRCPLPEKPDGPECKPEAPTCEVGKYCLQFNDKHFCEPCPERDSIRHEFRDRDFVAEQARDPFQSYVIINHEIGPNHSNEPPPPTVHCTRKDQFVATNYSFADLRLVGIVAQGTQRKVLMMDSGNKGHIIKRGDCVGKEKALVKEIGTGYLTFLVDADLTTKRASEEKSFQLHPENLNVDTSIDDVVPAPRAPVAPPLAPAPKTAPPTKP